MNSIGRTSCIGRRVRTAALSLAHHGFAAGPAAALALGLAGCPGPEPAPGPDGQTQAAEAPANTTDPRWIRQAQPHAKIAVVFVHGIFGDTLGTWTHANGARFFDLLGSAPGVGDKVDTYAFGFTSRMFGQGSQDIREASLKLHEYLQYHGVTDYDTVVFVAHSMGGLVAMRELISHPELSAKVPLLMFYATPQEGSDITRIAKYVVQNNAIRQMLPADGNDYLKQLSDDWTGLKAAGRAPKVICAYETVTTHGQMIVKWTSATRFCDEAPPGIAGADHISIVKPDRQEHESVVKLVNALRRYALPRLEASAWDTPDFVPEADGWSYVLQRADDLNHAGLINKSATSQSYRIALPQNSKLWISPETTPKLIPAGGREDLRLFVYGVPQAEYRFTLQLASLPERTVVVRIPDLAAAQTAKTQRLEATAEAINARIESADGGVAFQDLPDQAKWQAVAEAAQASIAAERPDLPAGARWVAAADTLSELGMLDSSVAALHTVEQRYPGTAKSIAVKQVAAQISAQSGRDDVPVAPKLQPQLQPRERPAGTAPRPDTAPPSESRRDPVVVAPAVTAPAVAATPAVRELSVKLQSIPATRREGLSLQGDVLKAQGDTAGAARAYSEAKSIRATPLLEAKLRGAGNGD
ncbi:MULTISPECIES: esterase/lipase family protein [Lysobacter]|uniref:Alpha/beta hydrolase n=1 Tax=Lysobacter firmicutimachus TaxID=1792846 RepID=A0ABU8D6Y8_9GAMM|nr:alpha/beta hydrolase [Lysobacter antibioticus]